MLRFLLLFSICTFLHHTINAQLDVSCREMPVRKHFSSLDSAILSGEYERITSVLVAQNGKLIFENYYGGADENSKHNTRSATKTMATLLTGIAIDKGFIPSEKEPILNYLQHKLPLQHPDPRKEQITIEDLLTMSSIMECDDNNSFSRGNEERMYIIEDWAKFFLDLPIRSYPWEPKPEDQPYGRAFSYCSAGAATIAVILETAVQMKLDDFARQHLFDPLCIEDYQLDFNPEGILNTAGGSEYKSRDFLKLVQLCLNKGQWNGVQVISSSWLEKATSPKALVDDGLEYGYLYWLKGFGEEGKFASFCMAGNGGQKLCAIPELNLSIVITTRNYGNRRAHAYSDEIINQFIIPAVLED